MFWISCVLRDKCRILMDINRSASVIKLNSLNQLLLNAPEIDEGLTLKFENQLLIVSIL